MLRKNFFSAEQVIAIVHDYRNAGLESDEVAIMEFAEKVTLDANQITPQDIETLQRHGLSDTDVLDVTLAAAIRCFFSKVLDAMGTEPDAAYQSLEPELYAALEAGKPAKS